MERKIRILQSLGSLGIGGNELFVMNFFRNIDKEKFQIDFVIYDDSRMDFYDEVLALGGKVHICKSTHNNRILRIIGEAIKTYHLLKKEKYDVIHCHNCSILGNLRGTLPGKMISDIKVISHSHNTGSSNKTKLGVFVRSILKWILSCSVDYGLACSDLAGKSKYTKKFINSDRYYIVNNAVNVERFQFDNAAREMIRNQYNINNKMVVGNVGRLAEQKNHRFLLKVFSYMCSINQEIVLMIVGGGELETELKEIAKQLCIFEKVIFTGMVNNAEKYYSAMDVFVMPSLFEGLPFTAIEAQVNGLQCVFSDTITQMANASGDVEYISLNQPLEKWSEVIFERGRNRSDEKKIEKVRERYDLKFEVKKLEEIYER